jgi:hypothetical protein
MEEGECTWTRVVGLSHFSSASANGWLCGAKTRAVKKQFFKGLIEKVIVPFVQLCRIFLVENEVLQPDDGEIFTWLLMAR